MVDRTFHSRLREPKFKSCSAVSSHGQVFSLDIEYLAIHSGGYVCMDNLCALIAAWLDAYQRSQDGV